MRKLQIAVVFLLALGALAWAQTGCAPLYQGNVLTPAQWQSCFAAKQDLIGYPPVSRRGDTMLGRLVTAVPGASTAGFNLQPGSTPSTPADGDVWVTTSGVFARVNGVTVWLSQQPTQMTLVARGVNFNSVADTQFPVVLPSTFGRYFVTSVRISHASQTLTTSQVGLFTAAGGTGTAIVASGTAVTVANAADATNNNAQTITPTNAATETFTASTLFFRVTTQQGATATGDVSITIAPAS